MEFFIPKNLKRGIEEFGEEGTQWLESLPFKVHQLEQEWGFRCEQMFDHSGAVSWVAAVEMQDGLSAVLKIGIPHEEAKYEAYALSFLNGEGAVRLLRVSDDGFSMLLERCLPGRDLWTLSIDEADAVAAELLPKLWRKPESHAPFVSLENLTAEWREDITNIISLNGYYADLAAEALNLGLKLASDQPKKVFLHGDFHPGNVLASQREPWLIIDPKPLIGDPAYDIAQWMHNRYHCASKSRNPINVLHGQILRFANHLNLDPQRVAGWTFVKAVGWGSSPKAVKTFHEVMQLF